jgi:hypothetical protein
MWVEIFLLDKRWNDFISLRILKINIDTFST